MDQLIHLAELKCLDHSLCHLSIRRRTCCHLAKSKCLDHFFCHLWIRRRTCCHLAKYKSLDHVFCRWRADPHKQLHRGILSSICQTRVNLSSICQTRVLTAWTIYLLPPCLHDWAQAERLGRRAPPLSLLLYLSTRIARVLPDVSWMWFSSALNWILRSCYCQLGSPLGSLGDLRLLPFVKSALTCFYTCRISPRGKNSLRICFWSFLFQLQARILLSCVGWLSGCHRPDLRDQRRKPRLDTSWKCSVLRVLKPQPTEGQRTQWSRLM